ncbi:hypothetical protein Tco_1455090 [Tanacetum coccineum]
MAVEVPQTLEYRGGQLNAAPMLEFIEPSNFTPWPVLKKRVLTNSFELISNTFKFKEVENLTQNFTRYKALMNELVNDGIKLSKLEINTGFINGLPKKWLSFYQSLRNTNHVKDYELASLFVQDFQDSPDDEEDLRSSQEYMNDLEESIMGGKEFTQDHRAREEDAFAYMFNRAPTIKPISLFLQSHPVSVLLPTTDGGELGRIARLNKRYGIRE